MPEKWTVKELVKVNATVGRVSMEGPGFEGWRSTLNLYVPLEKLAKFFVGDEVDHLVIKSLPEPVHVVEMNVAEI